MSGQFSVLVISTVFELYPAMMLGNNYIDYIANGSYCMFYILFPYFYSGEKSLQFLFFIIKYNSI